MMEKLGVPKTHLDVKKMIVEVTARQRQHHQLPGLCAHDAGEALGRAQAWLKRMLLMLPQATLALSHYGNKTPLANSFA
ncbi:hypothetical protein CRUP_037978 [Coryphaenoides rupestris]|nr:hypothetical protein CRUP_037978 [Coryphaenoides rupestris]